MSQYDVLDALIIDRLRIGRAAFCELQHSEHIRSEWTRLESLSGRDGWRILDGRLIALRKRGLIEPSRKLGWGIKP